MIARTPATGSWPLLSTIVSHVGAHYVIRNAAWNGTIPPGSQISFGSQADRLASDLPTAKKLNGVLLA